MAKKDTVKNDALLIGDQSLMKNFDRNGHSNNYSICTFNTFDIPDDVKKMWNDEQNYYYADYNYFKHVEGKQKNFLAPVIIALYKNEHLSLVIISKIINDSLIWQLGYTKIFKKSIRLLEVVYGGVVGETDATGYQMVVREIRKILKTKKIHATFFKYIGSNSEFRKQIDNNISVFFRETSYRPTIHRSLYLPDTYAEFYSSRSKNTKSNIKKYNNRIKKRLADEAIIKLFDQHKNLKEAISDILTIAEKTYQFNIGVIPASSEEVLDQWSYAAKNKHFRAFLLYHGEKPVAYWTGLIYKNRFLSVSTGYDPDYHYCHPGQYLLLNMIENFCNSGITFLDYGFGEADYKRRFGSAEWNESSFYIFSKNLTGLLLNTIKLINNITDLVLRFLFVKLGLLDKIKKIWRRNKSK